MKKIDSVFVVTKNHAGLDIRADIEFRGPEIGPCVVLTAGEEKLVLTPENLLPLIVGLFGCTTATAHQRTDQMLDHENGKCKACEKVSGCVGSFKEKLSISAALFRTSTGIAKDIVEKVFPGDSTITHGKGREIIDGKDLYDGQQ